LAERILRRPFFLRVFQMLTTSKPGPQQQRRINVNNLPILGSESSEEAPNASRRARRQAETGYITEQSRDEEEITIDDIIRMNKAVQETYSSIEQFEKVSVNCVCKVLDIDSYGGVFTKIQINPGADSLLSEVLYIKLLEALAKKFTLTIFPEYFHHFNIIIPPNRNLHLFRLAGVPCQAIQLKALKLLKPTDKRVSSLHHMIKKAQEKTNPDEAENALNVIVNVVKKTLIQYYNIAKKINLSHNDLHFSNMIFDGVIDNLKIIDFGRVHMNISYVDNLLSSDHVTKIYEKVKYGFAASDYDVFSVLKNPYQIEGDYNYLCDIAAVSMKLLPIMKYSWPEFIHIVLSGKNIIGIKISPEKLQLDFNQFQPNTNYDRTKQQIKIPIFRLGLYWYAVCLYAFYRSPITVPMVRNYQQLINDRFIYENGNIVRKTYNVYKSTAIALFNAFLFKYTFPTKEDIESIETMDDTELGQSGGVNKDPCSVFSFTRGNIATAEWINMAGKRCENLTDEDSKIREWKTEYSKWLEEQNKIPKPEMLLTLQGAPEGGGKTLYKIHVDEHNKKYIRKSNKRLYLASIRGKYRFSKNNTDYVMLLL